MLVSWVSRSFLLFDQELRIANHVNEQNMPDLEVEIVVGIRHRTLFTEQPEATRTISPSFPPRLRPGRSDGLTSSCEPRPDE